MTRTGFRLAAALLLSVVACGPVSGRSGHETPQERAARIESDSEQRRQAEIDREARARPESQRSGCDAPAGPPRAQVCVRLAGPTALRKGEGLRYRVEWSGLAARAGLIVTLDRAAPVGERWRYAGLTGPVQLSTIPVEGSGARDLEWNGRGIGCAPADAPTWCDGVERGAYILSAAIVDPPDYYLLGWPEQRPYRPLAWADSATFTIEGPIDMRWVMGHDRSAVKDYLRRRLGFFLPHYTGKLDDRSLLATARGASGYCAGIPLHVPLRGILEACVPRRLIDPIGVRAAPEEIVFSGEIGYLPGLIAEDRAEAIALRIALQGYEGSVDYIGPPSFREVRAKFGEEVANQRTWLETTLMEPSYRVEAGGYWLFLFHQRVTTLRGGQAGFNQKLLIKVEPDGTACRIDSRDMAEPGPDIGSRSAGNGLSEAEARRRYDPQTWQQPCPR